MIITHCTSIFEMLFLIGVAAMMALDLGLHKTSMNLPLVEHERRVRVFWNIYVYEKLVHICVK